MRHVCGSWKAGELITAGIQEQGLKREMSGIVALVYSCYCSIVILVWSLLTYMHLVLLHFYSSYLCVFVCVCARTHAGTCACTVH